MSNRVVSSVYDIMQDKAVPLAGPFYQYSPKLVQTSAVTMHHLIQQNKTILICRSVLHQATLLPLARNHWLLKLLGFVMQSFR